MDPRSHPTSARTSLLGLKRLIRSRDSSNEDVNQSSVLQPIPSFNIPDSTVVKCRNICVGQENLSPSFTISNQQTPGSVVSSDLKRMSRCVGLRTVGGSNNSPCSVSISPNLAVKRRIRGRNIEKIFPSPMCVENSSVAAKNRKPSSTPSDMNNKKCRVRDPNIETMFTNAMPVKRKGLGMSSVNKGDASSNFNPIFEHGQMRQPGQNYHLVGSLVSLDGSSPKFCQFYMYDTLNEVENRINAMRGASDNVDPDIVEELLGMLDKNNELVKAFRMAQNRFENEDLDEFKLVLISSQSSSGRPNHITPSDEVVAFIVSDDTDTGGFRDTVVNFKQEGLKRIYETNPHFMQLQYPLLFPWGTEGYHKCIPLINNKYSKIENLDDEDLDPDSTQRRHQQYVVDQFAAIEQYRLDWVSTHQTTIRADLYNSVRDALSKGDHDPMHMLIWLSPESRPNSIEKVDQLVSAEIPDKNSDPIAYEVVKNYMVHGPCGKDLYTYSCMVKGKCMRHFLKRFNGNTYFDDCGFPFYRRRNTGRVIKKKGSTLTINIPRSLKYLFKYCLKGHDTATMLLKKKSNKSGSEQTVRSVKNLDEVTNFLDGRYVYASEASWRIFGFDIHHRSPSVERLPIHFPGQKYLNFHSSADLENVCNNVTSKKSKLEAWFIANSEFPQARNFTYSDFPTQFTWIKKTAKWKLRQRGDVVGRLAEVHATTGKLLYLRMLLLRCKGALSFSQLRTIDGTTNDTFKEACGALGLLNNDKQ
ncbi:uncharacterized protein LOC141691457 [Apium graveolens]|uniref:uncharacterized protein LOC141691457 n=1 Tax=Apium graveolens TaxID=4045 RepID=UPI003D7A6D34